MIKIKSIRHFDEYIGSSPKLGLAYIVHDFLGCYTSGAMKKEVFLQADDAMTYDKPDEFFNPYSIKSIREVGGVGIELLCYSDVDKMVVLSIALLNKTKCRLEVYKPNISIFIPKPPAIKDNEMYTIWIPLPKPVNQWYSSYKKLPEFKDDILSKTEVTLDIVDMNDEAVVKYNLNEVYSKAIRKVKGKDAVVDVVDTTLVSTHVTFSDSITKLESNACIKTGESYLVSHGYSNYSNTTMQLIPDTIMDKVLALLDDSFDTLYKEEIIGEDIKVNVIKSSAQTLIVTVHFTLSDYAATVTLAPWLLKVRASKRTKYYIGVNGEYTYLALSVKSTLYNYDYIYRFFNIHR